MSRDLASEHGALRAHALLDERVPHTVHERDSSGTLDRLRDGPARAHVVDHLLAGSFREHGFRHERCREVTRDEFACVVDEEAAIRVPVIRDSEVRGFLRHLPNDELAVLREERIRLVVREAPVRLEVTPDDVELRQFLEHRREHGAGHPVRRVDDDTQRADRVHVDEGEDFRDEAWPDVLGPQRAASLRVGELRPLPAHAPRRAPSLLRRASAPRRTIFIPVYSLGLCEAVTQMPPSRPSSVTAW